MSLAVDLFYHLICLVITLLGNFAFLAELDQCLSPKSRGSRLPLLRAVTAVGWCMALSIQWACPLPARIASVCCIVLGCVAAPWVQRQWRVIAAVQGGILAAAFELIFCPEKGIVRLAARIYDLRHGSFDTGSPPRAVRERTAAHLSTCTCPSA